MKKLFLATIAIGSVLAVTAPANAAQGCGAGAHRGPHDHCRPNGGAVIVAPGLRIGGFYPGHGYWDGHRYYQHRERWHNGWRYR